MGKLAKQLDENQNRTFIGNTKDNPKEQCNVVEKVEFEL